ncbi:MAG: ankyrin repeat protein 26-like isoform [Gammaproteobacteria bacterium]|nr:ankyrin repeat protein 26-like isoform [Gammaproteobacteria bacterium]
MTNNFFFLRFLTQHNDTKTDADVDVDVEDTNIDNKFGTFLQACANGNSITILDCLKTGMFHIDRRNDEEGQTGLHIAVSYNQQECIRLLLRKNADVNAADREGDTPLHLAVLGGNPNIVTLLLKGGANVKPENRNGETPLDILRADKSSKEMQLSSQACENMTKISILLLEASIKDHKKNITTQGKQPFFSKRTREAEISSANKRFCPERSSL